MKKLIFMAFTVAVGYMGWASHEAKSFHQAATVKPLYDHPYVVVYGRPSCGYTQRTIEALIKADIKFEYMSVDDKAVTNVLYPRMSAMGLDTSHYPLPVVDVNNSLSMRPGIKELLARAKSLSK